MKYIRTKDENNLIIDMTDMQLPYNLTDKYIDFNRFGRFDIVRQADTIEELCDVIVCNEKLFYPLTSNREGNKFNWEEIISCSHNVICNADYKGKAEDLYFNIYDAIWTDKGLIYVAKMNDKGEWELL